MNRAASTASFQSTASVYCVSLLRQSTASVYCVSLLRQSTASVYCVSLLRQSTASVYCVSLLRQSTVTLSEDFGEGDFDLGSYSSKQAVFDFTAALGRMDVCAAALGIDYSDIREHRTPDSRRFSLRDHTRAIIRREHLHSDHR